MVWGMLEAHPKQGISNCYAVVSANIRLQKSWVDEEGNKWELAGYDIRYLEIGFEPLCAMIGVQKTLRKGAFWFK
jgi:hypothetical protein